MIDSLNSHPTPTSPSGDRVSPTDLRLDSQAVRVLAHPLRSRLLTHLRTHGPATATELATTLHTNSGATSYHLRALASVGLIEDTEQGEGRRRLWRAATRSHSWGNTDFQGDEDARAAIGWLRRDYVRQFAARTEEWLDMEDSWPAAWADACGMSDVLLTLTAAQLKQLNRDIGTLLSRYVTEPDQLCGSDEDNEGAIRIHFLYQSMPVDRVPPQS